MRLRPADLADVLIIESDPLEDARGSFGRLFCAGTLAAAGIAFAPAQVSRSCNLRALTLRGMHFQHAPNAETKLVQALRGRAYDVALDLRAGPGFGRWCAVELIPGRAALVPRGFAHGFLTLEDDTELLYVTDRPWTPEAEGAVRWSDPGFGIRWPAAPAVISPRDAALPDWSGPPLSA